MTQMPFKKLLVWQKAMDLVDAVYSVAESLPETEKYGFISQMRRATVSVASNIAEGSQRGTDRDFSYFISVSRGSLAELETQILRIGRRRFLTEADVRALEENIDELGKMLNAFQKKLIATR